MRKIILFERDDVVSYIGDDIKDKICHADIGIVVGLCFIDGTDEIGVIVDFKTDTSSRIIMRPEELRYLGSLRNE